MWIAQLNAIRDIAHELAPWAVLLTLLVQVFIARQVKKAKEISRDNRVLLTNQDVKLEEIHQTVNGRVEQLVEASSRLARQEGVEEGKEEGAAANKVRLDRNEEDNAVQHMGTTGTGGC